MSQSQNTELRFLIFRYVQALDAGDLETVGKILGAAETNAELDSLIQEINQAYAEELQLTPMAKAEAKVRELVRRIFSEPVEIENRPLTVGEVAARMASDSDLTKEQKAISGKLLRNPTLLPDLSEVRKLAERFHIKDDRFWRAFRDTALQILMGRGQARIMATRARKTSKPPARNDQEETHGSK